MTVIKTQTRQGWWQNVMNQTQSCLPHVMWWDTQSHLAAIKWFVKISLDHKLPESSAKSHPHHSEPSGQTNPLTWFDKQFLQRFSFLLLMILVMVKWSFNYGTIENIWCFKAHKSKNESILPSVPFSLSLSTSTDCIIQNGAEGFCEHLNVSFLKVSSAIHLWVRVCKDMISIWA